MPDKRQGWVPSYFPFLLVVLLAFASLPVAVSVPETARVQGMSLAPTGRLKPSDVEYTDEGALSSALSLAQAQAGARVFAGDLLIAEGRSVNGSLTKYAYFLRDSTGDLIFIEFTGPRPPVSEAGKRIEVYGQKVAEGKRIVTSALGYKILGPSPLSGQTAQLTGPQNYVTLLNKFTDIGAEPHSSSWFNSMIYGGTGSTVNTYFQEDSYGLISYAGAVFGWSYLSTYARTYSGLVNHGAADRSHFLTGGSTGTCGPSDDGSCLEDILQHAVATFDPSVNFATYAQGINLELNANIGCCAWGTIGNWNVYTNEGYLSRGIVWMPPWAQTVGIHGHENGHALGWIHSGLNYDDVWSQMSGGTSYSCPYSPVYTVNGCPSHSHGQEKEQLGWIPITRIVSVPSESQSAVGLWQLETSTIGAMLIKVQIPCSMVPWSTGGTCTLYIETRMFYGYDNQLPGQGVIITKHTTQTASGDWKLRPVLRGGTMSTAHYRVGDVYSEGNVRVEVLSSLSSSYFLVRVINGAGRPDLTDGGQDYSGFSPVEVTPGITDFSVWSRVRNVGTASCTDFRVSYYASTDSVIDSSDYLITNVYIGISGFLPSTAIDVSSSWEFPAGIPYGTYWVGWIIDSQDYVTELDETNNVAYKSSYQLMVSPPVTTITATVTHTSTSYSYGTRTTTATSYTSTTTSTSTIPTVTTVVLVPLTITSTDQSTQFLTSFLTTTVTSYTSTTTSTSTIPTTVALVPLTMTSTAQSTQYLTSILTMTVTSYTGTETSTSTIPTLTTVILVPSSVTLTVQSTQLLTSILTTTVTSYTATTTSTSTSVVYTTVTATPGGAGAGASNPLAYFGFISLLAITLGDRIAAGKGWRIPKVRSLMERRCSRS